MKIILIGCGCKHRKRLMLRKGNIGASSMAGAEVDVLIG